MARLTIMAISLAVYFAFFGAFLYLVGFVGEFAFMPTHLDKGGAAPPLQSVIIDIALIALFGLQHSVMARPGFKARITKIIPAAMERSVYCLATVAALVILFAGWHPIEGTLWTIEGELGQAIMNGLFWAGFGIVFISTWLINHFELFGLQQAWLNLRGSQPSAPVMRTPMFYKLVRHPIYAGFFLAFWATATMTYGHLLFAVGMTIYIMIGIAHEERDLIKLFGDDYVTYRQKVGAFIPGIGKTG